MYQGNCKIGRVLHMLSCTVTELLHAPGQSPHVRQPQNGCDTNVI